MANKKSKKKQKAVTKNSEKKSKSFWQDRNKLIALASVLIITFIVLSPSLQNGFVNWDDDKNFYENPLVVNSTTFSTLLQNIPGIFSTPVIGNFNPLSNLSFAIENVVFGMDKPMYFHLDNLLLHLICVLLVFRISLVLGLNIWGAAICALLFGIHPLRVESVTWVTERKDVLFGSFFLLALYYYIKGVKLNQPNKFIIRIIILFILSGLAKIQAVALPLAMIAVDYYLGRKVSFKLIKDKWFYFMISLAIGILGILILKQEGSLESSVNFNFLERLFIGGFSYIIYVIKLFVPFELSPLYPYPPKLFLYHYLSMIPALGIIALLVYCYKKEYKVLTFGIVFFTFNIIFLLQIVGAGQGFLADRFTYIAYFGFFFIIAYYIEQLIKNRKLAKYAIGGSALYFIAFGVISFNQTKIWKNSGTLWTHVLKYYEKTPLPWRNRANFNRDNGRITQALSDYSKAISLGSKKSAPYNSRAKLYFRSNNKDTLLLALQDYTTAISLDPSKAEYYMNRGATNARLQNFQNALIDLLKAGELNPNNQNVFLNRSIVYHTMGQYQNEINDINRYLAINPNNANMWANRANAKMLLRQWPESIDDINQALQINPNVAAYYFYRAQYYYNTGNSASAQQDLNKARQLGYPFNGSIENLRI